MKEKAAALALRLRFSTTPPKKGSMLDPFPVPSSLHNAIQPLTNQLHLNTLPLHIHEVLISYASYTFLNAVLSPYLSAQLLPTLYTQFPRRTKLQWNMHVTSFVNSTFVSAAALYVLYADRDRLSDTWEERMWGYTGLGGMVQAFGAGYFLWDVQVCATNLKTLGVMDLLHAVVALCIAILGFVCLSLVKSHPSLRLFLSFSGELLFFIPFWNIASEKNPAHCHS